MPVKTFKSRFKTVDDAVDFLLETQARTAESQAKTDLAIQKLTDSQAKTDAKNAEYLEKIEKEIAESQARTAELQAKTAKSQAETDLAIKELTKSQAETGLAIRELTKNINDLQTETSLAIKELTEDIKDLSEQVKKVTEEVSTTGDLGRRFGEIVEFLVIPGLRRAINATHKHDFKRSVANKIFHYIRRDGRQKRIAEIDLLLTNGSEMMAVEIKATLRRDNVSNHLERLKKMRKFAKETGLENKRLYGAVVGIYIDDDACEFALKNGLYLINVLEEEEKLNVISPKKARAW